MTERRPEQVFVALGSNLGDRVGHLAAARAALASLPDTRVVAASTVEETAPLAGMAQPAYLNQMVLLETSLDPRRLLAARRRSSRSAAGFAASGGGRGRWISISLRSATAEFTIRTSSSLTPSSPTATSGSGSSRS